MFNLKTGETYFYTLKSNYLKVCYHLKWLKLNFGDITKKSKYEIKVNPTIFREVLK